MWIYSLYRMKFHFITLSLYRNTAKDIYITLSKNIIISLSRLQSQKLPIIIAEAVWLEMDILHHMHFCTLLFLMRKFAIEFSQRARALNSSDSFKRLWLVIAFIISTESCVIGYNAQSCINASVSGSAPASEHRFDFSSWWFDALDVLIIMDTTWLYQI